MDISIVMTAYNRDAQLQKTIESIKSQPSARLKYEIIIKRDDRPREDGEFLNPAPLINQGLREAKGDIVILQNAECKHLGNVMERMYNAVGGFRATFASVMAENKQGGFGGWYCHPTIRRVPYFFCGAMFRKHFLDVMFDERFTGAGYDDVDFANRLEESEIKFDFRDDIQAVHQWHKPFTGNSNMNEVYRLKREAEGKEVRLYP